MFPSVFENVEKLDATMLDDCKEAFELKAEQKTKLAILKDYVSFMLSEKTPHKELYEKFEVLLNRTVEKYNCGTLEFIEEAKAIPSKVIYGENRLFMLSKSVGASLGEIEKKYSTSKVTEAIESLGSVEVDFKENQGIKLGLHYLEKYGVDMLDLIDDKKYVRSLQSLVNK